MLKSDILELKNPKDVEDLAEVKEAFRILMLYSLFFVIIVDCWFALIWFLIAAGTKRCHDINMNGLWQLFPIFVIALLFAGGKKGDNDYGPNPGFTDDLKRNELITTLSTLALRYGNEHDRNALAEMLVMLFDISFKEICEELDEGKWETDVKEYEKLLHERTLEELLKMTDVLKEKGIIKVENPNSATENSHN